VNGVKHDELLVFRGHLSIA